MNDEQHSVHATCPCGATFQASGYPLYVRDEFTDWRKDHAECPERLRKAGALVTWDDGEVQDD